MNFILSFQSFYALTQSANSIPTVLLFRINIEIVSRVLSFIFLKNFTEREFFE